MKRTLKQETKEYRDHREKMEYKNQRSTKTEEYEERIAKWNIVNMSELIIIRDSEVVLSLDLVNLEKRRKKKIEEQ